MQKLTLKNLGNIDLRLMSEDDFKSKITELQKAESEYKEEQEKIRKENAKLKAEQEAAAAKAKKIQEENEKKQREIESKAAKEKAAAEAKLKAEQESKAKIEKELAEKKAAEELAAKQKAEEAYRLEELENEKGDEDRFNDLMNDLKLLTTKYNGFFESKKNIKKYNDTKVLIQKVITHLNK